MPRESFHGITDQTKSSGHRRDDAQILFDGSRWRAAMYLGGYALECLFKARLMGKFDCLTLRELDDALKDRKLIPEHLSVYTHELEWLLTVSDLRDRLRRDQVAWRTFNIVNRWVPAWRYNPNLATRDEAEEFLVALDRILSWLRSNS